MSFLGRTQTIISWPEAIKFVLSTAHESFPRGYPMQFIQLLNHAEFVDERHPHFRKIILSAASGDGLQKLVPFISSLAEKTVKSWKNQAVVNSAKELKKVIGTMFFLGRHSMFMDYTALLIIWLLMC